MGTEEKVKNLEIMVGLLESRLAETKKELFKQKVFVQKILDTEVSMQDAFDEVEDFYYHKGQSYFDGLDFHFFP